MTSSLRDALRQSGVLEQFKPVREPEVRPGGGRDRGPRGGGRGAARSGAGKGAAGADGAMGRGTRGAATAPRGKPAPRSQEEIDLAKAYALRARAEQREREERQRIERETAERRRRQREAVTALLEGRTLNSPEADEARHFEYGGKIRRVYVTAEQMPQVNDGRLGVVQMRGGYLLVERALAEQVRAIDANAVALLVDPDERGADASGVPDPA
ncbi:MAG: DUF2058 family protein [Xanthomonadales bacterium]|nr:DUF2058 family protein [Xanthomonadales bacterium]